MSSLPTLADLILGVRRLADIETDGKHITDSEITDYVNDALKALWSLIIGATDGSLLSRVVETLPQIGNNAYQLPEDFLRLVSVDVRKSNNYVVSSGEGDPQKYAQLVLITDTSVDFSQHYIHFDRDTGYYHLFVFPAAEPDRLVVRYIQSSPQLNDESEVLKLPSDWVRWVIFDSAIRCMLKNETDPSGVMVEREKIELRVVMDVEAQSPSQVQTIRDMAGLRQQGRLVPPPINYNG
jgi:hypothetical protein